ncbi:hypothetical protein K6R05_21500 (plasmid) [Pantoea alfalfae]|uniref:hypothetical protein n=1 Tax=Pantoea alfalfae TaxID=3074822 RepID=UPI001CA3CABF|nr:hypothetical protein [Pantoea alfalfae]QZX98149.1 hypothetical protein K6R05_21500 [Pantoea alfalfae]
MKFNLLVINTLIASVLTVSSLGVQASNKHHHKHNDCTYLNGKNGDTTGNGDANGENGKKGVPGTSCIDGGNGGNGGNTSNGNANGGSGAPGANGANG